MERRDDVLTNPRAERVRSVRALSRRSVRERESRFVVEGPQAVREAVRHRGDLVQDLYVDISAWDRWRPILDEAAARGIRVREVSGEVLAAMADTQTPQGGLAVCAQLDVPLDAVLGPSGRSTWPAEADSAPPRLLVLLEHVRDPGNAGTVIRAADAAGADAVLVGEASVDVYNSKVVRSTAGSLFHLPIVLGVPMVPTIGRLRGLGLTTYAAAADGADAVTDVPLNIPHAWVLGNEAHGLSEEVLGACDRRVRVPIFGAAESLNLAMAATVCLYASAFHQRGLSS